MQHEYCYSLNSDDVLDPELPLVMSRATGGTLALWRKWLDPYITVCQVSTSSFLPIILRLPGARTSIHVTLYLPTHGKDTDYVSELANLTNCINDLCSNNDNPVIYIRGDGNANPKNVKRFQLLQHFLAEFTLKQVIISHPTYHHFVGQGKFDSNIDILLHSDMSSVTENVTEILCKFDHPDMSSHHDVIMSLVHIPPQPPAPKASGLISAPRTTHPRAKILWTEDGMKSYQEAVAPQLQSLRKSWSDPSSNASTSILLQTTNTILNLAAKSTNDFVSLDKKAGPKVKKTPHLVRKAKRCLTKANKKIYANVSPKTARNRMAAFKSARKDYRQAVRKTRLRQSFERDSRLDTILTDNPSALYSYLKSTRKTKASKIEKLTVGDKTYEGNKVADGFFDSMSALKTCDLEALKNDSHLSEKFSNYEHILKLCQDNHNIPLITVEMASDILSRLKANVMDFFGITARHYTNERKACSTSAAFSIASLLKLIMLL